MRVRASVPRKSLFAGTVEKNGHLWTECWTNPKNESGSGESHTKWKRQAASSLEQEDQATAPEPKHPTQASSLDIRSFDTPGGSPNWCSCHRIYTERKDGHRDGGEGMQLRDILWRARERGGLRVRGLNEFPGQERRCAQYLDRCEQSSQQKPRCSFGCRRVLHRPRQQQSQSMVYVRFQTKQPRCACSKRKAYLLLTRRSKTNACRLETVTRRIVRCVQEHNREAPSILHWGETDERGRGSRPNFVAGGRGPTKLEIEHHVLPSHAQYRSRFSAWMRARGDCR